MHPEINETREDAYKEIKDKEKCRVKYLALNRDAGLKELARMDALIHKDKDGKVTKKGLDAFKKREALKTKMNKILNEKRGSRK